MRNAFSTSSYRRNHPWPALARASFVLFLALLMLSFVAHVARAVWDGTPFDPGETLEPECGPSDPECRVVPLTSGDWTGTFDGYEADWLLANAFSTTSTAQFIQDNPGLAFSTTSANAWLATRSTDDLAEGLRLYYTDARVGAYIAGSSTIPKTDAGNVWTGTNAFSSSGLTISGLTDGCVEIVSGSLTSTGGNCGTSSGGIVSLNGLGASSQSFATSSDANIHLSIVSSGATHTFVPSWAGVLAAGRGGTGISSPSAGGLLMGSAGGWTQVATSSLGLPTYGDLGGYLSLSAWNATTTDALSEGGANLYYEDLRVRTYLDTLDTSYFFSTSSTAAFLAANQGLAFSTTSANTWLGTKSTDNLAEGSTNRYYTDARARSAFSSGSGITYSTSTGAISLNPSGDWTGTFDGQEGSYYLNRANHTGTQLASTISDFSTSSRSLLSSGSAGLSYATSSGVFSLASGYVIPLSASTTNWSSFYDTPSGRISAGTGLSWSGNTLSVSTSSLANLNADLLDGLDSTYFLSNSFSTTSANAWLGTKSTDNLAEGSTNRYFSNALSRSALSAGAGLTYSTSTGAFALDPSGDWTGTFDGQEGSYYLNRANHTGSQLSSTISDFSTAVRTLFSSGSASLSYATTTGAFTVTSGYAIPLTASSTDWNTAYLNRITSASAPLSITGNVISIANAAADGSTRGAAAFTASEFDAFSGIVSLDYANAQAASASAKGFLTAADWIAFNAKQAAGNYLTALTGDITASGPGTSTATLATVNGNVGTYNSVTVNAKGLVTAASNVSYQAPITLTTTGTSGAATFVGNTLNVPQYADTTYTASYPVTLSGTTFGLAFSTSTNNTWGGTNTFTNGVTTNTLSVGSLSGILRATAGSIATSLVSLASDVTGTLPVGNGGTGLASVQSGRVLYGNGTGALSTTTGETLGYVLQYDGGKPIWVATSTLGFAAGTGTVTSVGLSAPTGLTVTGSPVTGSGTLTLAYAAGYGIPLTASTTAWDAFYQTPSSRIPAGTNLSWSGNTLNGPTDSYMRGLVSAGTGLSYNSTTGTFTLGTVGVGNGGTGITTAPTLGQILMGNGAGGYGLVATSSLGLSFSSLTGTLGVSQGGTGATTFSPGFIYSLGGTGALAASTSPTVGWLTATSTTVASTFGGLVRIGNPASYPDTPLAIQGSTNSYLQVNIQNTSTGTAASTDFVATANNGSDTSYFIDMGINGSAYNQAAFNVGGANTGYLYTSDGGLAIGTASTTNANAALIFHTGGTTSSKERMRITAAGLVGIGTTTPATALDVNGDITTQTVKGCSGVLTALGTSATGKIQCIGISLSDERLKDGVTALDDSQGLGLINALAPVAYTWKDPAVYGATDALQYGFIAQDAESVAPNLVGRAQVTDLTPDGSYFFNYLGVIAPLVKSVQELSAAVTGFTDAIVTRRLCLEDVCVTRDELRRMLDAAGSSGVAPPTAPPASEPEPEIEPAPESEPEPVPEPVESPAEAPAP